MNGPSVLLIGGGGQLGRALIASGQLKDHDLAIASTRQQIVNSDAKAVPYRLIDVDEWLRNPEKFLDRYDLIVNFAQRRSPKDLDESLQFNKIIPLQMIAKHSHDATLIINSSSYVQHLKLSSDLKLYVYAEAKRQLSQELSIFAGEKGLNLVDISYFTIYGPSDHSNSMVSQLLASITRMEPFRTTSGDQLISLTFSDDVVKLISKLIHDPLIKGEFSYWQSPLRTVKEYITDIVNICGSTIPIEWGAYPYAGHEIFTDPSRFPPEIATNSWTDLRVGVQRITKST